MAALILIVTERYAAAEIAPHKNILIIHSYSPAYSWTDAVDRGIRHLLRKEKNISPLFEYMETRSDNTGKLFPAMANFFSVKYADIPIDLILCSDDQALLFLLRHGEALFPDTPVVFCGLRDMNSIVKALATGRMNGVSFNCDIQSNLKMLFEMHPNVENVAFLSDSSKFALANLAKARSAARAYPKIEFSYLEPHNEDELLRDVDKLPRGALLMPLGEKWLLENDGNLLGNLEKKLEERWDVLVYSPIEPWVRDSSAVGGLVSYGENQGMDAARMALRILAGEKPGEIKPILNQPPVPLFNYRLMNNYGIAEQYLPAGSIVVNQPTDPLWVYRGPIALVGVGVLILAVFILALLFNIGERKRVERELRKYLEENKGDKNAELPKGIQEKTLAVLLKALQAAKEPLTIDDIVEATSLSRPTVWRYMNYLVHTARCSEKLEYRPVGRPVSRYSILP